MSVDSVKTGRLLLTRREALAAAVGITFSVSFPSFGTGSAAAQTPPLQTAWITIWPDGSITIVSPAAEMGQGSRTSLALIIAEELDADWADVSVEMSPLDDNVYANPFFGFMYTAGSSSVQAYFLPLRLHAAQARRVLVDSAAAKLDVPAEELATEPSAVVHKASGRRLTFGEIASFARVPDELPVVTEADLKPASQFRYIGKDVMRVEVPTKVNGSAQYSIDVQVPGMVYGAVQRAPTEGSTPTLLNGDAVAELPGVLKIVVLPYGIGVVAKTPEIAFAAKSALELDWSAVPASTFDSASALERYAEQASDLATEGKTWDAAGDVATAMGRSERSVEAVYRTDYAYHAQMEPLNAVAYVDPMGTSAEVWCGTQAPTHARSAVARALEIDVGSVDLHPMLLGGGFGRRGHYDADYVVDAVLLSRAAKAPVKVIWTREDDVQNGRFRPMTAHYLKAGLDGSGKVVGWRHRVCSDSALAFQDPPRFLKSGETAIFAMLGSEQPHYDLPDRLIDHVRRTDGVRLSSLRGTGNPPNAFATECFIDEVALATATDPLAFRRQLLAKDPRALAVLEAVATMSDWERKRPEGHGAGLCFRNEGGTLLAMVAEVSVDRQSGQVKVHKVWVAIDAGLAVQPDNIVAQVEGAVIYTIGAALFEQVTISGGAVDQSNFSDYVVPRMSDVPEMVVEVLSTPNPPSGIAEVGSNVTGAIANAVAAATGTRLRHMPMTPERVLDALKA